MPSSSHHFGSLLLLPGGAVPLRTACVTLCRHYSRTFSPRAVAWCGGAVGTPALLTILQTYAPSCLYLHVQRLSPICCSVVVVVFVVVRSTVCAATRAFAGLPVSIHGDAIPTYYSWRIRYRAAFPRLPTYFCSSYPNSPCRAGLFVGLLVVVETFSHLHVCNMTVSCALWWHSGHFAPFVFVSPTHYICVPLFFCVAEQPILIFSYVFVVGTSPFDLLYYCDHTWPLVPPVVWATCAFISILAYASLLLPCHTLRLFSVFSCLYYYLFPKTLLSLQLGGWTPFSFYLLPPCCVCDIVFVVNSCGGWRDDDVAFNCI